MMRRRVLAFCALFTVISILPASAIQGDAIPGVDVSIEQSPGGIVVFEGTSDGNGHLTLPNLKPGTYLLVRKTRYLPVTDHTSAPAKERAAANDKSNAVKASRLPPTPAPTLKPVAAKVKAGLQAIASRRVACSDPAGCDEFTIPPGQGVQPLDVTIVEK